ncbi:hypothetical protein K7X08_021563 [Anisodus acutangulus]|uniref:F-box domain-containing protein n=1 Tax=Anisodus acutangulus TaxID=402998 RepID=A0A9Q1M7V8_9SOLA|nr:hypothetical protein K7X08_021563 [Anisodus acutangulus]
MEEQKRKWRRPSTEFPLINNLDDGCLMHIFSFLSPIPDRYNTALVCHRWRFLACHPRLWLRVDRSVKDLSQPGAYPNIEMAVSAARPGDTILIAAGGSHRVSNIQIEKPLCLIGAGESPDDTTLICSRSSDSALEFRSTCKLANLTEDCSVAACFTEAGSSQLMGAFFSVNRTLWTISPMQLSVLLVLLMSSHQHSRLVVMVFRF